MNDATKKLFSDVISELENKIKQEPNDKAYESILSQINFIYECQKNGKDIAQELNGRELDFQVIASRNLSGPEQELLEKIGDVALYVSSL